MNFEFKKGQFSQRLRRHKEWATEHIELEPLKEKLLSLKEKAPQMKLAYDFPDSHRTSNLVDRLMNYQDRILYDMQYFHGTLSSARLLMRAQALIWNFHPYGSRTRSPDCDLVSPFKEMNGFSYHENWLHSLLIAGSMNGYPPTSTAINKIR